MRIFYLFLMLCIASDVDALIINLSPSNLISLAESTTADNSAPDDAYFNSGGTVYGSALSDTDLETGSVVDTYDNILSYQFNRTSRTLKVTKIDEKGSLVTAFGTSGVYQMTFSTSVTEQNFDLTIDPTSNDIIISFMFASNTPSSHEYSIFIMKLKTATGTLDSSFGSAGLMAISNIKTLSYLDFDAFNFLGVRISKTGKIYLGLLDQSSMMFSNGSTNYNATLHAWRLSQSGSIEKSGLTGSISSGMFNGYGCDMVIDEDENIYIAYAGKQAIDSVPPLFETSKYILYWTKFTFGSSSLSRVTDFGSSGNIELDDYSSTFAGLSGTIKLSLFLSQSKLVAAVYSTSGSSIVTECRDSSTGNSDSTFISGGSYTVGVEDHLSGDYNFHLYDASMLSTGELIVVGKIKDDGSSDDYKLAILKLKKGATDESFGDLYTPLVKSGVKKKSSTSSWDYQDSISCILDSGDSLIVTAFEYDGTNRYSGVRRFLAADNADDLIDASSLGHVDLYSAINYTEGLDNLKAYLETDSLISIIVGVWAGTGVPSSEVTNGEAYLKSAVDSFLNKAISRASANSFDSCLIMKYKKGVADGEIYSSINSTNFTAFSTMDTLLKDFSEMIAGFFEDVRSDAVE